MKLGTQVRLIDGREGTVVYNSLIGVGIKWGLHNPDPADFEGTTGNIIPESPPKDWPWEPVALLRDEWPGWERYGMECVGSDFTIIRVGGQEEKP